MSTAEVRRRGKRVAGLAGLGAITIVVLLTLNWHTLVTHYRLRQLDRSETFDAAKVLLDPLLVSSHRQDVARVIVGEMGPDRPTLTFWLFYHCAAATSMNGDDHEALRQMGPLLPLVREFGTRVRRDEQLLASLAYFVRWCGPDAWKHIQRPGRPSPKRGLGDVLLSAFIGPLFNFDEMMTEFHAEEPEGTEVLLRFRELVLLAEAWILGVEPPPELPNVEFPKSRDEKKLLRFLRASESNYALLQNWVQENRDFLLFDESLGRFVIQRGPRGEPIEVPRSRRTVTVPEKPCLDWTGPIPPRSAEQS